MCKLGSGVCTEPGPWEDERVLVRDVRLLDMEVLQGCVPMGLSRLPPAISMDPVNHWVVVVEEHILQRVNGQGPF